MEIVNRKARVIEAEKKEELSRTVVCRGLVRRVRCPEYRAEFGENKDASVEHCAAK